MADTPLLGYSTDYFQIQPSWSSWDDVEEYAYSVARQLGVSILKKSRWSPLKVWKRFSTKVPTGPILLAHDFYSKSTRARAETLIHELAHHVQERTMGEWRYGRKYLSQSGRAALEAQAYATGFALRAVDERFGVRETLKRVESIATKRVKLLKGSYRLNRIDKSALSYLRDSLVEHFKYARNRVNKHHRYQK